MEFCRSHNLATYNQKSIPKFKCCHYLFYYYNICNVLNRHIILKCVYIYKYSYFLFFYVDYYES